MDNCPVWAGYASEAAAVRVRDSSTLVGRNRPIDGVHIASLHRGDAPNQPNGLGIG
jgi:hypothetical protein